MIFSEPRFLLFFLFTCHFNFNSRRRFKLVYLTLDICNNLIWIIIAKNIR